MSTSTSTEDAREKLDILVIEDETDLRATIADTLREAGHVVTTASDGAEGMDRVLSRVFDIVLCDVRLPKVDGLTLLRRVRRESLTTDVILMTAFAEVSDAVAALKEGAYDYLAKPFSIDELLVQVGRNSNERAMRRELAQARAELARERPGTSLVGQSPSIRRVVGMIDMVSKSDAPTLVTGESGTGKELVARMLHERGGRAQGPFVTVNCGALAENLIEAELFGHERGAFTGAVKKRDGRFKAADGGTIFLDEIAELPPAAQTKLLRVLQEGTFEPVGSNTTVKVDVRVVSATHRNLKERIRQGLFREDLYYRVNVIEIPLPPLRERPGDLPLLLQHFLRRFIPNDRPIPVVSPEAWAALARYSYPGNVRELSHALEHAVILSGGGEIGVAHLPASFRRSAAPEQVGPGPGGGGRGRQHGPEEIRPLAAAIKEFEREYILLAVAQTHGKRARAADLLGISRKSLWEKLKMHGISDPEAEIEHVAAG